jgi:hypothetical protein
MQEGAAQNLVFESVQRKYAALRNREVVPGPDQTSVINGTLSL